MLHFSVCAAPVLIQMSLTFLLMQLSCFHFRVHAAVYVYLLMKLCFRSCISAALLIIVLLSLWSCPLTLFISVCAAVRTQLLCFHPCSCFVYYGVYACVFTCFYVSAAVKMSLFLYVSQCLMFSSLLSSPRHVLTCVHRCFHVFRCSYSFFIYVSVMQLFSCTPMLV